jgi:pimeloyl-ACP methyl ester carboxylesterase
MRPPNRRIGTLVLAIAASVALAGCSKCGRASEGDLTNSTDPHWVEHHNPQAQVAVVFVHGIFGDTVGTWTHPNGTSFFDLIEKDPDLGSKVDTYAFGYPSKMVRAGSFDIQEAASRLHSRLQSDKITDYPAIVFVAHSMGGLVVMRELLTHRDVLERVRALVFFATPQEGAQIANIASHVANNPALAQMLPADQDGYLRLLNDEWKALPKRPPVECAYEKRKTKGFMIVGWSSATRFCDDSPLPIDEDHIGIVKPDRRGHDSYVLFSNALNKFVLNKSLVAKLETPDFYIDNDRAVLTISSPFGRRDVRLVNAGGTKLSYTLREFPDHSLYVAPGPGPSELGANSTQILQFVLGFGATESEYRFVLQSDAAPDLPVVVKFPDLPTIIARQGDAANKVLKDLQGVLNDPAKLQQLKQPPSGGPDPSDQIVQAVRESLAKQDPGLMEGGQWLQTAELMNAVNWPGLATRAIRNAVRVQPDLQNVASVRRLAARTSGLSGEQQVLAAVPPLHLNWDEMSLSPTPFTTPASLERAADVAVKMQGIPGLAAHASSLRGDVRWAQGDRRAAVESYSDAVTIKASPLGAKRLAHAKALQRVAVPR